MLVILEVGPGILIVGVKVQVLSTSPGCRNRLSELYRMIKQHQYLYTNRLYTTGNMVVDNEYKNEPNTEEY